MDRSRHPSQSSADHCHVKLFHGSLQAAQWYRALTAVAFIFARLGASGKRLKFEVLVDLSIDSQRHMRS
jgi:hypothetical protein